MSHTPPHNSHPNPYPYHNPSTPHPTTPLPHLIPLHPYLTLTPHSYTFYSTHIPFVPGPHQPDPTATPMYTPTPPISINNPIHPIPPILNSNQNPEELVFRTELLFFFFLSDRRETCRNQGRRKFFDVFKIERDLLLTDDFARVCLDLGERLPDYWLWKNWGENKGKCLRVIYFILTYFVFIYTARNFKMKRRSPYKLLKLTITSD